MPLPQRECSTSHNFFFYLFFVWFFERNPTQVQEFKGHLAMEEFYTGNFNKFKKSHEKKKKTLLLEDHEDFQEEDVWPVSKERGSSSAASACHHHFPAFPRKVVHHQSSSASINIPDRPKIYNKKSNNSTGNDNSADHDHQSSLAADFLLNDDDGDEDNDEMIPPHEIIARRVSRSPVVSFSMCEGIGRTLKGRDLSRLRNAILTKTGFLE